MSARDKFPKLAFTIVALHGLEYAREVDSALDYIDQLEHELAQCERINESQRKFITEATEELAMYRRHFKYGASPR